VIFDVSVLDWVGIELMSMMKEHTSKVLYIHTGKQKLPSRENNSALEKALAAGKGSFG